MEFTVYEVRAISFPVSIASLIAGFSGMIFDRTGLDLWNCKESR